MINRKGLQFLVGLGIQKNRLHLAGVVDENILAVRCNKRMLDVLPGLDMFQCLMCYCINNSDRITAVLTDVNLLQIRGKACQPAGRPRFAMADDHIFLRVDKRQGLRCCIRHKDPFCYCCIRKATQANDNQGNKTIL